MDRYFIISEQHGLISTCDTQDHAENVALINAVNTGRTVYVHDRLEELK